MEQRMTPVGSCRKRRFMFPEGNGVSEATGLVLLRDGSGIRANN